MSQIEYQKNDLGMYELISSYISDTGIPGYSIEGLWYMLHESGKLTLFFGYMWNGVSFSPDAPPFMRMSAGHDALFDMMRRGLLPMTEFMKTVWYAERILIQDQKAVLPPDVKYHRSVEIAMIVAAISSPIARAMADPANYVAPKIMVSPDPDYEIPGTEEHTDE